MATLLRDAACGSCGTRHHFYLPGGALSPGQTYSYSCPMTGQKALLRPDSAGEDAPHPPQGAVHLAPAPEAESKVGEGTPPGHAGQLQDALPEVAQAAQKVGGYKRLADIAGTLDEMGK